MSKFTTQDEIGQCPRCSSRHSVEHVRNGADSARRCVICGNVWSPSSQAPVRRHPARAEDPDGPETPTD